MSATVAGIVFVVAVLALLAVVHVPVGDAMARMYQGTRHLRVERLAYRAMGVDPDVEQRWSTYLRSVLAFSAVSVLGLYLLLRVQQHLPFGLGFAGMEQGQAFNTAASFVTNTNWQSYSGESTLGYVAQAGGLAVQNFASAAVGMAVAIALVRGFARARTDQVGNFWVDMTRTCVRVLLPAAVVVAVVLVAGGAIQNWHSAHEVTTLAGAHQTLTGGPVASQESIKELGTNGGGFYNANSAHPFENPTAWTNFIEVFALLVIAFSLPRTFGRMVGDKRQGWAIAGVVSVLFVLSVVAINLAQLAHHGTVPTAVGASYEGVEQRFGVSNSATFASATTLTSTGAVNSFHDSYTSFGGLVTLLDMQLGEIAPGGVGSGLYGILVLAVITVFVAGLMVGRTPEYLGKKIGRHEITFASLYFLTTPLVVLLGTGIAMALPGERAAMLNTGAHGLSEVLYAFTSAGNNNGSAFAGISVNTTWYNTALGLAMLLGRFVPIVFVLGLAGSLAGQQRVPVSDGTLPTHKSQFVAAGHRRRAGRRRSHLPARAGARAARRRAARMTLLSPPAPVAPAPSRVGGGLLEPAMLWRSLPDAVVKLDPRTLYRNPVMFLVEVGSVYTTWLAIRDHTAFAVITTIWLWATVLFANLAEAVAEGRGKAQADTLRRAKTATLARRLEGWAPGGDPADCVETAVNAPDLRHGDVVVVDAGEVIPGDGDVVDGIASVDESAITGESAPVIRESGGDRSSVTGGTRVLSDRIVVRITQQPGQSFIDRMIALVEGASRQKTPNEIALNILLASLTFIFLLAVATLQPLAIFSKAQQPGVPDTAALTGDGVTGVVLVSLLVCLIPTTIGALLSAIGIAGMDRLVQRNVLAMSGRAVEAAGDVDTLLLDKTGTITLGNRQAVEVVPVAGTDDVALAGAAQLASLADETPEGRSVVVLAKSRYGLRERPAGELAGISFVPFTAQTRMSGVDLADGLGGAGGGRRIRKGAASAVRQWVRELGGSVPDELGPLVDGIAAAGGTPLVVAEQRAGEACVLGVIHLKDVVKSGMRERFDAHAGDGHPHGHDHWGQPADGESHRGRGRRRRLPRRGHARGQDGADQAGADRRQARRDDR